MAANTEKRTKVLLLILLILMIGAVYTNSDLLFDAEAERRVERSEISLGERLDTLSDLPGIPLDRPYASEDYAAQRNLFDYSKSPAEIAAEKAREKQRQRQAEMQRKKREQREERQAAERRQARQQQREERERIPPPPDFKYTYVAYMKHLAGSEDAMAVLVKGTGARDPKKENIRIVRNGEILDDDFVIREIDLDNLVVGYTDERYSDRTQRVELIPPRDDGRGGRGGGRRRRR